MSVSDWTVGACYRLVFVCGCWWWLPLLGDVEVVSGVRVLGRNVTNRGFTRCSGRQLRYQDRIDSASSLLPAVATGMRVPSARRGCV